MTVTYDLILIALADRARTMAHPAAYRQMAITEVASFFYLESKACRMTSLMSDSPTANEIIGCFSTFGPSQPSITFGSIEV